VIPHVVFRAAARRELMEAALWYEQQRDGLGSDFRSEVERSLAAIAERPTGFPVLHRSIRCIRVRRFPYSIFIVVEPDRLVVLAVFHVRRNPLIWQSRA